MVKAVDIEGLIQKYVEEDSLERADALYLLFTVGSEYAARTLRGRYGRSGALSSVLDDLKALGIEKADPYKKSDDTGEELRSIIQDSFKRVCFGLVAKSAKARSTNLSQKAREILYIISAMRPESVDTSDLKRFYKLLFQKTLTDYELESALDELLSCYVIQSLERDSIPLPPYFEDLLQELRGIMPKVEVKVSWPEIGT